MSVEGVVVRREGMLCRGCFKGPIRRGRVLWWRTITWQLVGEDELRNQGLIQAPGRRRVRMQRKLLVKLGQSFSILQEYLEDRLTVHTLSARSGRHRSGVSLLSLE